MTDTEQEIIDSTTDTEMDAEITLDDASSEVDVEALKEQNKRLFERAKKAEAKLKSQKTETKPSMNITNEKPNTYGIDDEVLDLRLEGYSKQQVEFIMRNGGRKSLDDKNSLTYIAINQQKEQDRAERAASQTMDNSSVSEVERKYTAEQLNNMTISDLEKILPHA